MSDIVIYAEAVGPQLGDCCFGIHQVLVDGQIVSGVKSWRIAGGGGEDFLMVVLDFGPNAEVRVWDPGSIWVDEWHVTVDGVRFPGVVCRTASGYNTNSEVAVAVTTLQVKPSPV